MVSREAASRQYAALEASLQRQLAQRRGLEPPEPSTNCGVGVWLLGGLFVVAASVAGLVSVVGLRKWNERIELNRQRAESMIAEDPAMAELLQAIRASLQPGGSCNVGASLIDSVADSLAKHKALLMERLRLAREGLEELSRTSESEANLAVAAKVLEQVQLIKHSSETPNLRPVGVLSSALEGLMKQLSTKVSNITPSALRTAAEALDLIESFSNQTLRPDLATVPPVRLLVVDDEPLSRRALVFSLIKVFNDPDLAADGRTALGMAANKPYDLILLDVEMPGLDGFEVCTKIHLTATNCATPVVFVTSHTDFETRSKGVLSGGHDLIGKPFLTFEITVKVLTLVLKARAARDREQSAEQIQKPVAARSSTTQTVAVSAPALPNSELARAVNGHASDKKHNHVASNELSQTSPQSQAKPAPTGASAGDRVQSLAESSGSRQPTAVELARAFFEGAPAHLVALRDRLTALAGAPTPSERDDVLGGLFVGVHAIRSEADRAQLSGVSKLGSALEVALKKLLSKPKFCTPSILETMDAAIDTIEQICQSRQQLDIGKEPVQLLVVDDDPVAQRLVVGALQVAFGRPDTADCGEAALALAEKKSYDLVFMDVLMPGMDGYTTCSKFHALAANRHNPVVFVTSEDDMNAQRQATEAGGSGFISKPVLPCQITLLALTQVMRRRLGFHTEEVWEKAALAPQCEMSVQRS